MPQVSYSTPTADNGQAANTIAVAGAGLLPSATVTLNITATGSPGLTVSGPTDAEGAIAATIAITDPVVQNLLGVLGAGQWNDPSASWAVAGSDGTNTITMTCAVA